MTNLELFASIGLPVLLVASAYVSVLLYEWNSRSDLADARHKSDANPV